MAFKTLSVFVLSFWTSDLFGRFMFVLSYRVFVVLNFGQPLYVRFKLYYFFFYSFELSGPELVGRPSAPPIFVIFSTILKVLPSFELTVFCSFEAWSQRFELTVLFSFWTLGHRFIFVLRSSFYFRFEQSRQPKNANVQNENETLSTFWRPTKYIYIYMRPIYRSDLSPGGSWVPSFD